MIKEIHIKNFKSIIDLRVKTDKQFNIIIGENNIGKTTIFEAIHLWKICYEANIQKRNKNLFYSNPKNINFADNEYLRVFEDKDLFNTEAYKENKDIFITICLDFKGNDYNLGFKISKVKGLDNAYLQVEYIDKSQFIAFSDAVNPESFNLTNVILICESRPIANIVAKEPYMYKAQILDKLRRGKGYEVLRNKIIKSNQEDFARHMRDIMGKDYTFSEVDKDNKTYIRLMVNGTNILSQGSGFLQIAEIFSSLEYSAESDLSVLLIDEPDSHIHISLQRKLIEELRGISKSQVFIITHNEKFIDYIPDEEILYIDTKGKQSGTIEHLQNGYKNLILKGLSGTIDRIDELRNARTIFLCEGETDVNFIRKSIDRYSALNGIEIPNIYIEQLYGIDTLCDKLLSYSRAYNDLIQDDVRWIVLRDSDCLPLNMQSKSTKECKKYLPSDSKEILYQNGYGVESIFVTEVNKLCSLLIKYYKIPEDIRSDLSIKIEQIKEEYSNNVCDFTSDLYKELKKHFERQKRSRSEYKDITFEDFLSPIAKSSDKIQYIFTKKITDLFLTEIHLFLSGRYQINKDVLNSATIIDYYLDNLDLIEDFYECHLEIIQKILNDNS